MIAPNQESKPIGYPVKVLHLEDSEVDHLLVKRSLQTSGLDAIWARVDNREDMLELLHVNEFDLVVMDYRLPGFTALEAWAEISKLVSPPPCVIVSGTIGEAAAVAAIQTGVSDYLHKDNLEELSRVVQRTLKLHRNEKERVAAALALQESEMRITELARHLQTSLEEERAAISREIHDEIGGSLAAIKLDIAWLKRHTSESKTLSRLDAVHEMLELALKSTQRIMKNTRPAILDQGLGASVQWLTEAHARRLGRTVTLRRNLHREDSLTDACRLTAYRTVQESLTNVSKYASESNVKVDLSDEGDVLTVEITDDGPGFNPSQTRKKTGFGLKGLSERAKNVGGWLDVSSVPGRGTSITLTIPLLASSRNEPDKGAP